MQYKKNNQGIVVSKEKFKKTIKKKCVFFDRDNTLIIDRGYTYKTSDLIWKTGAIKAIKYLNKLIGNSFDKPIRCCERLL